jgi:hypothetical protein
VLGLFDSKDDVRELIAKKKFERAIELLDGRLQQDASNPRLRLQLADALVQAGKPWEAIPLLVELADYYAYEGEAAKAIATLKKIERIAPGRRDVETRLASLIRDKNKKKAPWTVADATSRGRTFTVEQLEAKSALTAAEERIESEQRRIAAARSASWSPSYRSEEPPAQSAPAAVPPPAATPSPSTTAEPAPMVAAGGAEEAASEVEITLEPSAPSVAGSPLFSDFDEDELLAVMHGLRLLTFEPGDIIITEGDPGDSLFVLTTGAAKAFIKRDGKQVLMRTMGEGAFFGEISILSGRPRTATVTAAAPCELLELDRKALDEITAGHPHVRTVLEDFYIKRASGQPD